MKRPEKDLAVEIFATQPDLTVAEVAVMVGVTPKIVKRWRENINFMEAIYDRYMVEFGGELPAVLCAMVREAKSGNVQAGRLVLEHSGKLVKNVNVTIDSPFEKFMKKVEVVDVIDAEIIEEGIEIISEEIKYESISLPERKKESPVVRVREEKRKIKKSIKDEVRRQEYNRKQKIWYQWKRRAMAVGVEPLPSKRPTKGQRKAWEDKIVRRENGKEEE
tara:strand:- start:250 stop:906 length:657 start_codon:yes stop_codon:yes gene_type:complete